jgi:CheY-like chemotaxis protein
MELDRPVIIIEDDYDDQIFLSSAIIDLGYKNQLRFFHDGEAVLTYLQTTTEKPFLIISDINLPGMTGTELKKRINGDESLRKKAIPFIFYTTSDQKYAIDKAYEMMVQGFFVKENSVDKIKSTLKIIMDYWKLCKHPNSNDPLKVISHL